MLVAAVLQNLDDDDGAGEAQDQRDVYSHGEIGGAEGAKRAEGGDEARANQRHHKNMGTSGEPDCLIHQRSKIQTQADGEEHEGHTDIGEKVQGINVFHTGCVECEAGCEETNEGWEPHGPSEEAAYEDHTEVNQQEFHGL